MLFDCERHFNLKAVTYCKYSINAVYFMYCLYRLKVYHLESMLNMQALRFEHHLTLKAVRYYKYSINVDCFMYCFTSLKLMILNFICSTCKRFTLWHQFKYFALHIYLKDTIRQSILHSSQSFHFDFISVVANKNSEIEFIKIVAHNNSELLFIFRQHLNVKNHPKL